MEKSETAKILAKAALIDNRKIDRETVEAWHEVIGHVPYDIAMAALTIHRRTSSDYLVPAHIISNLRKARELHALEVNRLRALDPPKPAPRTKMPEWFRDAIASFGKIPEDQ
ncbi:MULTISPECIES: hypothetical protein [Arthrobacter]|uniref:Replicative helicase inhibitor G39P N-terminal domain-containing protein n=1 Tax=Arthrobacter terricola TaxID=2547396 RepID=A0A4R5KNP8_9MICC|nr:MULTISPECIES: hypothetical protein [Arthrobacter]MBT8161030.1 hypothetical protein [Arthrobacter sp. GN70]TDF96892.1 hypothetical protein E1809_09220 [Arthrobacter terricola]